MKDDLKPGDLYVLAHTDDPMPDTDLIGWARNQEKFRIGIDEKLTVRRSPYIPNGDVYCFRAPELFATKRIEL